MRGLVLVNGKRRNYGRKSKFGTDGKWREDCCAALLRRFNRISEEWIQRESHDDDEDSKCWLSRTLCGTAPDIVEKTLKEPQSIWEA